MQSPSRNRAALLGATLLAGAAHGALLAAKPKPKAKPAPKAKKPAVPRLLIPSSRGGKFAVPPVKAGVAATAVAQAAPKPAEVATAPPLTYFQTNSPYDPRLDLKTDVAVVHMHGASAETVGAALRSWKNAGYTVHRMLFIGSDAGRVYSGGMWDGKEHADEIETDRFGAPIAIEDRPYMVPTAGWLNYLKDQIKASIDADADGIWPEEPLLHAGGGYSPAFKAAWQQQYGMPWKDPYESPAAFFQASRLKSDLYLRAVDELSRFTREYGRTKGRDIKFFLPVHSPVGYAGSKLIFPHAAASRLNVDAVVAQVWTGPARVPVTYEGVQSEQVFEKSWMLYSAFAGLMEGVQNKSLIFLTDPVEDDPKRSWDDYGRWYRFGLAASLLFPQPRGYEVMPWPDRIHLPGSPTASGSPPPPAYLTQLANLRAAQADMPPTLEANGATRGVGVLTLDTMMWQRGGPSGSSMRSLDGLVMPLLKAGVPVDLVPGERAGEAAFMARYKVLLLSYDMQKPLGPEINQRLADWVKAGGTLILFGGEDEYNTIGEWWSRSGFGSPTDQLLRQLNLGVEVQSRTLKTSAGLFKPALAAEGPVRDGSNRQTLTVDLAQHVQPGKPLFVRFSDLYPNDGWGPALGRVRVIDGGKTRADFLAGTVAERPFLVEQFGSKVNGPTRFADGEATWTYRFNRLSAASSLQLELSNQYRVEIASGDLSTDLEPAVSALPKLSLSPSHPVVSYPIAGAEALYRLTGQEALPAWTAPSGQGRVVYSGVPAAFCADTPRGSELVRGLVKLACDRANLPYVEGPLIARRGPYVIAHSLGRTLNLKGAYLDLTDPDLGIVEDPQLPYKEQGLYKALPTRVRIPTLVHASHRARVFETAALRTRLRFDGPQGTRGVARLLSAGMSLAEVTATDASGGPQPVETRIEGATVRLRYPQLPNGLTVTLRWSKSEERLTK